MRGGKCQWGCFHCTFSLLSSCVLLDWTMGLWELSISFLRIRDIVALIKPSTHYGMHFRNSNNSSYLLSIYSLLDPALNALHLCSCLICIVAPHNRCGRLCKITAILHPSLYLHPFGMWLSNFVTLYHEVESIFFPSESGLTPSWFNGQPGELGARWSRAAPVGMAPCLHVVSHISVN